MLRVEGERIAAVRGWDETPGGTALRELGEAVLLPAPVDSHVHINEPGRMEWVGIAQELALPLNLEGIAFSEEEGVRYGAPFLGSRAVAGRFDNAFEATIERCISMKPGEIFGLVDVNFAAQERDRKQRAGRMEQQRTRALVAAEGAEKRERTAREDGRRPLHARVSRRHNRRLRLRGEGLDQCAQVLGRESRLIAVENQRARSVAGNDIKSLKARMNRSGDSPLPPLVDDGNGRVQCNGSADDFEVGAEHREHRRGTCFAGQTYGPRKQCLSLVDKQLLWLAEAAACTGGKNDGGNRGAHGWPSKSG